MPDCIIENLDDGQRLTIGLNGPNPQFILRSEAIAAAALDDLEPEIEDLLDIAAMIFYADGEISRGGATRTDMGEAWHRRLRLTIPVRNLALWSRPDVGEALTTAVDFLTGDTFEFRFLAAGEAHHDRTFLDLDQHGDPFDAEDVILFSGGLDSFSGALETLSTTPGRVILVSHQSAPKVSDRQKKLAHWLEGRFGKRVRHIKIRAHRSGDESTDTTQRSRSFLFAAMGAAVAHTFRAKRISFFENGIVSHNLPISPQVVGTMATRTTHPLVLVHLNRIISLVLPDSPSIYNPYEWMTKTEVVGRIQRYGGEGGIEQAVSCTKVREQTTKHTHCGTCSQCLDRRFAILAAGLEKFDPSESYATDVTIGTRKTAIARTMGVEWTRHVTKLSQMSDVDFLGQFGSEISLLMQGFPDWPQDETFRRLTDMHRRQSRIVIGVLAKEIMTHAPALAEGRLSATSLLVLHMGAGVSVLESLPVEGILAPLNETLDLDQDNEEEQTHLEPPNLEFSVKKGKPWVAIRGLCDLSGNAAIVTHLLRKPFSDDRTAGVAPDAYRFSHITSLPGCSMSKDDVRAALSRCRKKIDEAFLMQRQVNAPIGYLIETKNGRGHRLNPASRIHDPS